jgi:hypothetical protein
VPAHQGVGGDVEGRPTRAGEQSTESGEDRPIDGPGADTSVELALEDPHLVAEHHLELLAGIGALAGDDEPEEPAKAEVKQREGQSG